MDEVEQFLRGLELDNRRAAVLTAVACGVGALVLLARKVAGHREAKDKIRRARDRRTESLQRAEQAVLRYKEMHPTTDSAAILSLSLSELTKQLREGVLSPEDVFYSYVEKTLAVHKKLNCCTGILLESFDQLKTINSSKDGLLYGVPVSIKENIGYKNQDSSCGIVINLGLPDTRDSVLVEVLKLQGAIPFVKTNIPQALLSYDCSNPIYGQTRNPCNLQKTSGGSSGGEGALIGGGGSLLGLGSDIGGSIRIPASFCGICGFKPTTGRLSSNGVKPIYRGQKSVFSSAGPMAKDVESLALCMQALLCDHMFSLDPTVPPIPFNVQIYHSSKPLRIGYIEDDGYMQPTPSMARAIREIKNLLEQAGHTLVPYRPPRIGYVANELLVKGILADGGTTLLQKLEGSPLDPSIRDQVISLSLPTWMKKTLLFLIKPLVSHKILSFLYLLFRSVKKLWEQHAAAEDYTKEVIEDWRRCNIEVMLCPVVGPAYSLFYCGKVSGTLTYAMLYNLLNFPAGVVPVSMVTAEDEEELKHYKGIYQDHMDKLFKEAVTGGEGLPVAVQCVALPWRDELCLRLMKEVEKLVKQSGELTCKLQI
uniref:Fatty-acid amide hydrolase 1 n=1 Tax=Echeneis naucrates TaxID=173247 RepID=A0A665UE85_ECHNA